MQEFGREIGDMPYVMVDRPKTSLRVASLLVWSACGFLFYKSVVDPPPESWALWGRLGMLAIFAMCCYAVIREFMLRPTRVTTISALQQRQVVVQEIAPWRKRDIVASIPPGARFETFPCESDNDAVHGVRIKSVDKGWLTVAEYVPKQTAERLAREANSRLVGW